MPLEKKIQSVMEEQREFPISVKNDDDFDSSDDSEESSNESEP